MTDDKDVLAMYGHRGSLKGSLKGGYSSFADTFLRSKAGIPITIAVMTINTNTITTTNTNEKIINLGH